MNSADLKVVKCANLPEKIVWLHSEPAAINIFYQSEDFNGYVHVLSNEEQQKGLVKGLKNVTPIGRLEYHQVSGSDK